MILHLFYEWPLISHYHLEIFPIKKKRFLSYDKKEYALVKPLLKRRQSIELPAWLWQLLFLVELETFAFIFTMIFLLNIFFRTPDSFVSQWQTSIRIPTAVVRQVLTLASQSLIFIIVFSWWFWQFLGQ